MNISQNISSTVQKTDVNIPSGYVASPSKSEIKTNTNQTQQGNSQSQQQNKTEDFVKKMSETSIESADIEINSHNSKLKFSMHRETNQVLGRLVDKDTQEVIKEFPPEEIVEMIAAMEKRAGLFIDTKK